MNESEYYNKLYDLQKEMREFQKQYQNEIKEQQYFYIKLMAGVVAGIGILMTLLKFWS